MKRFLAMGLTILLAIEAMTGGARAADNTAAFDFSGDDSGFTPIFADYPNTEGVEAFYEFRHEYGTVPIPEAGNGLFISGNNHSDDLFMGYVKMLDGFIPGRTYRFTVSFQLATNVESGLAGVGGAPGEGVAVKCGITATEPQAILQKGSFGGEFRMNIDKGAQSNSGKDMITVGDMAKDENKHPGEYEFKEFRAEFSVTANRLGQVYLIIGTDSGFESTTSYYLDNISVSWKDAEQPSATRAQAAQMLFDTADRASADPSDCIFKDVAIAAPYTEAITWAQQNGCLSGYGDGRFGPEDPMNTEQAMEMIYRFFGSPKADPSILSHIEGGDRVSSWARDAVAWSIANDLFKPAETISPQAPITVEALTYAVNQIVTACSIPG